MTIHVIKRRISPRQQQRREHIIACTRDLISVHGATFSMEAVAEASNTSRSTLYRYFSSREHLVSEVTLDAGNRLIDFLSRHPPSGKTLGENVEALCRQINHLAEVNVTLLATCVTNITSEDPAVIDAQAEIEQLVGGIFSGVRGDIQAVNQEMIDKVIFRYLLAGFKCVLQICNFFLHLLKFLKARKCHFNGRQ